MGRLRCFEAINQPRPGAGLVRQPDGNAAPTLPPLDYAAKHASAGGVEHRFQQRHRATERTASGFDQRAPRIDHASARFVVA